MKILYRRCAALDVHKKTVCACIRKSCGKGPIEIERETFGTYSCDLDRLGEWLTEHKVRRVAMESTGVYWIPVWNVLEATRFRLELMLVNPATVKALPGCKTDPKDAARIAELHQYGLLRGSFVPPRWIRQLRDLVRRRTHLQQDRNRITNRLAALLETANVKLGSVASDITGVSGRRMLYAISEGESDAVRLAGLALGRLQDKQGDLVKALQGRFSGHFRAQLRDLLEDLQYTEKKVERVEQEIRRQMEPHADLIARLCTIPGVDQVAAWTIVAEIGVDMSVFPTAAHVGSWAGLCPGNDESAGKRRSGRTRKGNRYLRRMLVQCAWAVTHSQEGFLYSLFLRIARRRGMKKAALAVAHRILVIAYHIIGDGVTYRELGQDHADRQHPLRTTRRLVERLANLGFDVELRPKAPESSAPAAASGLPAVRRGRPPGSRNRRPYVRSRVSCPRCDKRGIPCIHGGKPVLPERPANPDPGCPKCKAWGIPCIHARNQLRCPSGGDSSDLSGA